MRHLPANQGTEVLQPPVIRWGIWREDGPGHGGVIEPPMAAAGFGRSEAIALKFAPNLFHLVTGRQSTSPWLAAGGV